MSVYLTFLMFFSMLPYIQIFSSASYTQPYYLLVASLGTVPCWLRISHAVPVGVNIFVVGLAVFGILIISLSNNFIFGIQELKYLVNYLSPFILFPIFVYGLIYHYQLIKTNFSYLAMSWILVGTMQLFFDPSFATFLLGPHGIVSENVINSGRGAISLSPEPTHFGLICLLFAVISHYIKLNKSFSIVFLISAILVARSATALVVLFSAYVLVILTKSRRSNIIIYILLFSFIIYGIWSMQLNPVDYEYSRILNLIALLFSDEHSVLDDRSVAIRLGGLILGIQEIFANFGLPFGGSQNVWLAVVQDYKQSEFISHSGMPSGWGIVIFQSGYIGLTLIGLLFYNIFTYKRKSFSDTFYTYIFILVFSVQFLFTSPLFALCLAVFFVRDNNENVRNNDLMEKDIV